MRWSLVSLALRLPQTQPGEPEGSPPA